MDSEFEGTAGAQTLGRAIDLLRLLAMYGAQGARLLDLASASNYARPTVHRLLRRLCAERLVAQDPDSKRYVLGPLAFELGMAARSPIRRLAHLRPEIDALAAKTGDTVYLIMRTGDELVCVYLAEGAYPIRARTFEVGVRRPLGTGAAGIALLASMRDEEARALVGRNIKWLQRLGVDAEELLQRTTHARAHGAVGHRTRGVIGHPSYGAVGHGIVEGVTGVAMSVPANIGAPYLVVSIGAITARMPEARITQLWKILGTTVKRIAAIELS